MKKLSLFGLAGVLIAAGVFATSASVLAAPTPIFNDGFESSGNLTGWNASGNWQEGGSAITAHSGTRQAEVHGPTGIVQDHLTHAVSTAGYVNINFSYAYRITKNLEHQDHVRAQYSTDNGANWVTVADYTNEASGGWQTASFNLPAAAANNPNFKIRFRADLDAINDELHLDDIAVTGDPIVYTTTTTVVQAGDLDNTSSSPAVVRADGLNKWFEYNDTTDTIDNTLGTFVSGPSTAPLGAGSIQFSLAASNSRDNIATYQFGGTPLSSITTLSYSAYSHSGVAGATESPYLNFNVDFNGSHTWQKRLVYVPSANGSVPQDQWNTFDTISGGTGLWTWSGFASNGNKWPDGNTNEYRTWSDITSSFPNATVLSTDSWLGVRVGEPGPTNYVGNVDNLTLGTLVGTNLTTKTFDFEPYVAPACDGSTTFDTYTNGSVNGQGGWAGTNGSAINPAYDQAVVDNTYNISSFGCKTLRVSDAVTSQGFGDWIFTPSTTNEAGETAAVNNGLSGGTRQNHFVAQFDFASAQALGLQPGQHISVSPDRGDGARMSYVRLEDQADGIHVFFDDVTDAGPVGTVANFNETDIATVDRTTPHTIKFDMTFVDGPHNDIVKVYVDGALKITGTSWEDYYRYDPEQAGSGNQVPTVDSLIIQARGSADPTNLGKGFLFDNFNLSTDNIAPPAPTPVSPADNAVTTSAAQQLIDWTDVTDPFTPITYVYQAANTPDTNPDGSFVSPVYTSGALTDSQIPTPGTPDGVYYWHVYAQDANGNKSPWSVTQKLTVQEPASTATVTTNPATNITASDAQLNATNGINDAQGHSFWVSTAPFSTSSPSIPAGVYSTPDLGAVASSTAFSANLSVVTTSGVPGNMPAIQPNTTYYVVAWVNVGGTWYPGDELSFTTSNGAVVPTPSVTTNTATGVSQTDATLNGTNGPVDADAESFWVSTSSYDTSTPNIPAGVYSTPVLAGVAATDTFSDLLSLVTTNGITTGGVPGNMSAITPGTTYYYNAWAHINGTWYPGAIQTVTTNTPPPPPPDTTVPVLTLNGNNPAYVKKNATYGDLGVTITDTPTNNLDYTIATDGAGTTTPGAFTLDTSTEGTHVLTYSATDGGGNTGTTSRTVIVDGTAPTAVLSSDSTDPTTDNPIHVTATFSEAVTGFDQTDISASSASIGNFQASSTNPLVYTFDVTPTGSSISVSIAQHKYTDLAGNENETEADFTRTIGSNTPSVTSNTNTGGGGGGNGSPSIFGLVTGGGLVLGTSTVNDTNNTGGSCSPLITTYMGLGKKNDPSQVKLLQTFLNGHMNSHLPVTGFFGGMTFQVVKQFQVKYVNDVLTPWGINDPTGYVYKLTQKKINDINCATQ